MDVPENDARSFRKHRFRRNGRRIAPEIGPQSDHGRFLITEEPTSLMIMIFAEKREFLGALGYRSHG